MKMLDMVLFSYTRRIFHNYSSEKEYLLQKTYYIYKCKNRAEYANKWLYSLGVIRVFYLSEDCIVVSDLATLVTVLYLF
jgi:hypothetical protein